ncbi:MAG: hypothetical protein ACJAS9_003302, partial [Polaribacter sp.]
MLLNHSIVSSSDTRQKLRSFYRKDENKVLDKIIP